MALKDLIRPTWDWHEGAFRLQPAPRFPGQRSVEWLTIEIQSEAIRNDRNKTR